MYLHLEDPLVPTRKIDFWEVLLWHIVKDLSNFKLWGPAGVAQSLSCCPEDAAPVRHFIGFCRHFSFNVNFLSVRASK